VQLLKAQRSCYPEIVLRVDEDLIQHTSVDGVDLKRTM
jgi:hypothetical protein